MSYATDRAIQQGIDSARQYRKDGESPYHMNHPMFRYWWEAVVMKSDFRDFGDNKIHGLVNERVK